MKIVIVAFVFNLFVSICLGQTGKQQTVFGSEMETDRPVNIRPIFLSRLNLGDRRHLQKCQSENESQYGRKLNSLENFVGSEVDVRNGEANLQLLIVKSNSACFDGAHSSKFWILAKKRGQSIAKYRKIFEIQADGLSVNNRASSAYPNLEVFSHTAVEGFYSTFKYVKGKYRNASCYVEQLGDDNARKKRVRCSKYNWEFRK